MYKDYMKRNIMCRDILYNMISVSTSGINNFNRYCIEEYNVKNYDLEKYYEE